MYAAIAANGREKVKMAVVVDKMSLSETVT